MLPPGLGYYVMLLPWYHQVWVIKSCYYHVTARCGLLSHVITCYHQAWVIKSCYYHVTTRFGLLSHVISMLPPGLGF